MFFLPPSYFDFILSSEHVVDFSKVVGTWNNCFFASSRLVVFLEVGLLSQNAHLPYVSLHD